jgi:hypothetical protein
MIDVNDSTHTSEAGETGENIRRIRAGLRAEISLMAQRARRFPVSHPARAQLEQGIADLSLQLREAEQVMGVRLPRRTSALAKQAAPRTAVNDLPPLQIAKARGLGFYFARLFAGLFAMMRRIGAVFRPPKVRLPQITLPQITLPQITLPKVSIPQVSLPKVAPPKFSLPKFTSPEFSFPQFTVPKFSLLGTVRQRLRRAPGSSNLEPAVSIPVGSELDAAVSGPAKVGGASFPVTPLLETLRRTAAGLRLPERQPHPQRQDGEQSNPHRLAIIQALHAAASVTLQRVLSLRRSHKLQ